MAKIRGWGAGLGIVAATVALATPGIAQDEAADAAFERAYAAFSAAYRAGDPAGVASLYTDDAFYLAPGQDIARGEVERHFAWLDSFEPGAGPFVEFEIVDRDVEGDLAYDIGYFRIRRDADAPWSRGKFVVVWKRGDDGEWRIHADGFSDAPAAEGQ